jgi:hypothetical protein
MAKSSKRLVQPSTLLGMFKGLGYELAILNGTAAAGVPIQSEP